MLGSLDDCQMTVATPIEVPARLMPSGLARIRQISHLAMVYAFLRGADLWNGPQPRHKSVMKSL